MGSVNKWLMGGVLVLGSWMASTLVVADQTASVPKPSVSVPVVDQPPVIDGQLDDACWKAGTWNGGFRVFDNPSQPATAKTVFQWGRDASHLYLAVRVEEDQMAQVKPTRHGRDSQAYSDDSVELMLAPNGDGSVYYHWAINSGDGRYDAQVIESGRSKIILWNSTAQIATTRQDTQWTVEMAIPLADISLSPDASKTAWRFNLARNRRVVKPAELSSFAPMVGGFHEPSQFAYLQLTGLDASAYQWQIHAPIDSRVVKQPDGLRFQSKLVLHNRTGKFRFVRLNARLDEGQPQTLTAGIAPEQSYVFALELPVVLPGRNVLYASVEDRSTGAPRCRWQVVVQTEYCPLVIQVTRPAYRQSYFASQTGDRVEGVIRTSLTVTEGQQLIVDLMDPAGTVIQKETFTSFGHEQAFSFPFPQTIGDYTLQATLVGGEGSGKDPIAPARSTVRRLAPGAKEIWIDEHGITHMNGKPFMPYGWFSITDAGLATAAAAGCNVTMDYNNYYRTPAQQQVFMDKLHQAGVQLLSYPYPKREMDLAPAWQRPLSTEEAEAIRSYVAQWKNHPALLAWYVSDEPELRPALLERVEAIYRVVSQEDPYHPCVMLNDTLDGIRDYASGGDVMMPDPYPHFLEGGLSAKPIDYVSRFVREVAMLPKRKANWLTPQAFNYADFGRPHNRGPNFVELRNMMYQGVINGSTGFVWYSHHHTTKYPQMQAEVHWLAREAHQLQAAILTPPSSYSVTVTPSSAPIQTSLRRIGSGWYLFAVNVGTEPTEVQLTLPSEAPKTWQVMSEQRSITAANQRLTDYFAMYQVHVYFVDDAALDQLKMLP